MDYRFDGSFKQRARKADRTSRQLRELRRQRVAASTQESIKDFEEHLKNVQEAQTGAIDDLPIEAEAESYELVKSRAGQPSPGKGGNTDATSSTRQRVTLSRAQSDFTSSRNTNTQAGGGPEVDARYDQRPPSPLGIYDYGVISSRPRSVLAQRSKETGEPMRPGHRQSTPGFYQPGAEFRRGPYGFSLQDPILMPPRSWSGSKETPNRWAKDAGDLRPATTEGREHRHRRGRTAGPLISEGVESAGHHDKRASLAFRALDKRNEEASLEQVRFEHGVFEGRWRDPLLDPSSVTAVLAPPHDARCSFLGSELGEHASQAVQVASLVLFGVERALRTTRGTLSSLFRAVNRGAVGVLEPSEFLDGLVRIGVVQEGQLSLEAIMEAMSVIDPSFDGRINFLMLERAVSAARGVQRQREKEAERLAEHHEKRLTQSYGASLPIDVVKVDRLPKSLFNFDKARERFRKQQKELLSHHGEITH